MLLLQQTVGSDVVLFLLSRCEEDIVSLHEDQTDCSSLRYDPPLLEGQKPMGPDVFSLLFEF